MFAASAAGGSVTSVVVACRRSRGRGGKIRFGGLGSFSVIGFFGNLVSVASTALFVGGSTCVGSVATLPCTGAGGSWKFLMPCSIAPGSSLAASMNFFGGVKSFSGVGVAGLPVRS